MPAFSKTSDFGPWLQARRRAADLTQSQLAAAIGCSTALIFKLERGERRPSQQIAALLAERLQIPLEEREAFIRFARGAGEAPASVRPPTPEAPPPPSPAPAGRAGSAHRLRLASTPLIGRNDERAELLGRLREPACRLVTVVGPGGIGKTRLAAQIVAEQTAEGVDVVALTLVGVETGQDALAALADALALPDHGDVRLVARILDYLRGRELLLVLDNLEHLLDDALVDLLAALVGEAPRVRILATSREPLRLSGEWILELGGLPLAGGAEHTPGDAMLLFASNARRLAYDFALTPENSADVTRICRMLDGVPLGIELAAAWVTTLTPAEIAAELERSIDFLASRDRDMPVRHRSMRASFEGSWRLLAEDERAILARLSVFRGSFTRDAAAAVAGAGLPQLAALIRKSLVRRLGDSRYELHEVIRHYSAEQLRAFDPSGEALRLHFDYFLKLAAEVEVAFSARSDSAQYQRLDIEIDNLRAALGHAVRSREVEQGARLCLTLRGYWGVRSALREGLQWVDRLLAFGPPDALRGGLQSVAATLLRMSGQWASARERAEEAVAALRHAGDSVGLAVALQGAGLASFDVADYDRGHDLIAEAQALFRAAGMLHRAVQAKCYQGQLRAYQGRLDVGRLVLSEALEESRALGDRLNIAHAQTGLTVVASLEGSGAGAAYGAAALPVLREFGYVIIQLLCMEYMAAQAGIHGRHELAARILAGADRIVAAHQIAVTTGMRLTFDRLEAIARGPLDPAAFAAARAVAAALPLDELIAAAVAFGSGTT